MNSEKMWINSAILNRRAHLDVYTLGEDPNLLVLLFGGSGIDDDEYKRRGNSLPPFLSTPFKKMESNGVNAIIVHITSPYDVPLARFPQEPNAARDWCNHVYAEIASLWPDLRFYVWSFSGGAALGFHGVHQHSRCLGGCTLGTDQLPATFLRPSHWNAKLMIISAPQDRVCHHSRNREIIDELVRSEQAIEYKLSTGGHSCADYLINDGLELLTQQLLNH